MARKLIIVAAALALIAFGWIAGRAQMSAPDFEIRVDAPVGATYIECVRGCKLVWVERGINPNAVPQNEFQYSCSGRVERCKSGRIGGWVGP